AGPGHTETDLPRSIEEAQAFLSAAMPLPPSLTVFTGGGLHAYWLFKETWRLEAGGERREAQLRLRHFQGRRRARARERGWKLESTADLARVLRLPGTWNRKTNKQTGEPLDPVLVRVLE